MTGWTKLTPNEIPLGAGGAGGAARVPLTPAAWAYGSPRRLSGPDTAAAVGIVFAPVRPYKWSRRRDADTLAHTGTGKRSTERV